MQNKPNLLDSQMNVSKVLTKGYENKRLCGGGENKAKTKPIKPNLVRRLVHRSFSEDGSISEGGFKRRARLAKNLCCNIITNL